METIRVQKTLTDLSTLDDALLVKEGSFSPANDVAEALSAVGGDNTALLEVINDGLRSRAMQALRADGSGWHTFKLDESGEPTDEINGPFEGQVGDSKKINNLILSLAKSVFGFEKGMSKDAKKAAKESAIEMIKTTPAIKNGLAKTAALTAAE